MGWESLEKFCNLNNSKYFEMKKLLIYIPSILLFASCSQSETTPPNIVFIMSDDHAFQAISAYGYGLNNTPNIDRIAQEGALFKKGFVTN